MSYYSLEPDPKFQESREEVELRELNRMLRDALKYDDEPKIYHSDCVSV